MSDDVRAVVGFTQGIRIAAVVPLPPQLGLHLGLAMLRDDAGPVELPGGQPVDKIARMLYVSTNTVKTQMKSLYTKLDTHSRADTLIQAREHGLLASPPTDAAGARRGEQPDTAVSSPT